MAKMGGIPNKEYQAFVKWLNKQRKLKGFEQPWWSPNIKGIEQDKNYQTWASLGKPEFDAPLEPSQSDIAKELSGKPIYTKDYPEPPYGLSGGFKWEQVTFDPNTGMPVEPQWIPTKADDVDGGGEPTRYQGFTAEEWTMGIPQFMRGQDENRWAQEELASAQRTGSMYGGYQRISGQDNSGLASTYDEWKQRLLGELTEPRDWITRWQVQQQPNPYTPQTLSYDEEIEQLERETKEYTALAKNIKAKSTYGEAVTYHTMAGGPEKPESDPQSIFREQQLRTPQSTEQQMGNAIISAAETSRQRLDELRSQSAPSQPQQVQQDIGGIPIPRWLPQFVPGLAGQSTLRGTPPPIATPSPQQWARTPYSQREGLAGYSEFQGTPFIETLESMQSMTPRSPNLGTAWRPARQR